MVYSRTVRKMSISLGLAAALAAPLFADHPQVASLDLHDPPTWYSARLPSSEITLTAGKPQAVPLTNGPFTALALTAVARGGDTADATLTVQLKLADGSAWTGTMTVPFSPEGKSILHVFWPPAPFSECQLAATRGEPAVQSLRVQ